MSPHLFGLFLTGMEERLKKVQGQMLQKVLHADDLVLISNTKGGLQRLKDCVQRVNENIS